MTVDTKILSGGDASIFTTFTPKDVTKEGDSDINELIFESLF